MKIFKNLINLIIGILFLISTFVIAVVTTPQDAVFASQYHMDRMFSLQVVNFIFWIVIYSKLNKKPKGEETKEAIEEQIE
jgi:hypothetical protein